MALESCSRALLLDIGVHFALEATIGDAIYFSTKHCMRESLPNSLEQYKIHGNGPYIGDNVTGSRWR
jgi:hypothetical protein